VHELSLVSELVEECCRQADGNTVSIVKARCCLPDLEEELQQGFVMLTTGTPLEGAVLEVEQVPLEVECSCGYAGEVEDAGIVGHMFVCPSCGQVRPIHSALLELMELRVTTVD
jgi:hydrogenase nickel incorporation protein HypA/HybF